LIDEIKAKLRTGAARDSPEASKAYGMERIHCPSIDRDLDCFRNLHFKAGAKPVVPITRNYQRKA
jgi:hypothetical protein